MSFTPRILFQDEHVVAVAKPSGFHVHPPEMAGIHVPRERILLYVVRNYLRRSLYPVHRLDAGTSGVLLFALHSQAASVVAQLFQNRQVKKTYHAVIRGYVQPEGLIDEPLGSDSSGELVVAETEYRSLAQMEVPTPVGRRHATARYSLVEVLPRTGRYHQIRRHFARISHPVLGDAQHGDSHHNRFFRETLGVSGLCLRASQLWLQVPWRSEALDLRAPVDEKWAKVGELFSKPPEV